MLYDLIIIGGGPAGVTAGIYAGRQHLNTLLITKTFGGQMTKKTVAIENYPGFEEISGFDLIKKLESHLRKQKIEILNGEVLKIEKRGENFAVLSDGKEFQSQAVIVASGAEPRKIEVPGEKEFIGRGVSYCVHCDGPVFAGKTVAVLGGGNAGAEAALFLAEYCSKVYLLESSDKLSADQVIQKEIRKNSKIEIIFGIKLKEIKGQKFVQSIILEDAVGSSKELALEGLFIEIGHQPAGVLVGDLADFNEKKEIIADPDSLQARTAGLFAAGDIKAGKYKQIIIACGDGAKAALSAYEYLRKKFSE